jgi:hypothetical protein
VDYYGGSSQLLIFAMNGEKTPDILKKYQINDYPTFVHILPNMDCNAIEVYTKEIEDFSYTTVLDWMLKRIEGIVFPTRMPPKVEAQHGHDTPKVVDEEIPLQDDTKEATVIEQGNVFQVIKIQESKEDIKTEETVEAPKPEEPPKIEHQSKKQKWYPE